MKKLILSSVTAMVVLGGTANAGLADSATKVLTGNYREMIEGNAYTKIVKEMTSNSAKEIAKNCFDNGECIEKVQDILKEKARSVAIIATAEAGAASAAVAGASTLGVTASTGTAISALSGAAATSATMAAIGSSAVGTAVSGVAAAVGIVAAPAVVGAAIVTGVGALVGWGVSSIFDD